MDQPQPTEDVPFETIVNRLEFVVQSLEEGDLSLEDSLRIFEEGVTLTRLGNQRLDRAEQQIEILLADEGGGVRTERLTRDGEVADSERDGDTE